MSYDVYLMEGDDTVKVESHSEGGTYALGGSDEARLNITYNYAEVYSLFGFRVWDLDGKTGQETVGQLKELVAKLGTRTFKDYWAPTPGNAGHALNILVGWAEQYPQARWRVS